MITQATRYKKMIAKNNDVGHQDRSHGYSTRGDTSDS